MCRLDSADTLALLHHSSVSPPRACPLLAPREACREDSPTGFKRPRPDTAHHRQHYRHQREQGVYAALSPRLKGGARGGEAPSQVAEEQHVATHAAEPRDRPRSPPTAARPRRSQAKKRDPWTQSPAATPATVRPWPPRNPQISPTTQQQLWQRTARQPRRHSPSGRSAWSGQTERVPAQAIPQRPPRRWPLVPSQTSKERGYNTT